LARTGPLSLPTGLRRGLVKAVAEQIASILQEERNLFTEEGVRGVIERHGLEAEEPLQDLVKKVQEIGRERALKATGKFFECLELPTPQEVEEALRSGGAVRAQYQSSERVPHKELAVDVRRAKGVYEKLRLPFPDRQGFGGLSFSAWTGYAELYTQSRLHVINGGVFFRTADPEDLLKALEDACALRPFLSAVGLSDLEGALETLTRLGPEEKRVESEYVLARGGGFWALRRGAVSGDPLLDGTLLAEGKATLSFPGDVDIYIEGRWEASHLKASIVRIRLGGEEASFTATRMFIASVFNKDPIAQALKSGLKGELRLHERGSPYWDVDEYHSPKMLAFLVALAEHEDPLRALAEGKLHLHATAELFSQL
jgi:hypothetical protein